MQRPTLQPIGVGIALFLLSVLVRLPLFGHPFTDSWEWLSAHTLLTTQLWNTTAESVHHFNLLYTFPAPASRFIDDLWASGVMDRSGNYYYVSMPQGAFLTPWIFVHPWATIPALQIFTLCVHMVVCALAWWWAWRLTQSRMAAFGAMLALLFAPTALYFFQNAVVGAVLVIPYTLLTLVAAAELLGEPATGTRRWAWTVLGAALVLGCLTDWQAYFTAFAVALVALVLRRRNSWAIAAIAVVAVVLAIALITAQDSRINGLQPFLATILYRFQVRSGHGSTGLGLTTAGYYRNMARFYGSYLPWIALGAATLGFAWRRNRDVTRVLLRSGAVAFAIAVTAVAVDHVVLANHTAQQSFTTLHGLIPIALIVAFGVAAWLKTGGSRGVVILSMAACCLISLAEYYVAYWNRPAPFVAAAAAINAAAQTNDVVFARGGDYEMPTDGMIPQILYYLGRNAQVVHTSQEAAQWLAAHHEQHGVLATINRNWTVVRVEPVTATDSR